ncbi:MAG: 6-hydroxymethyl-7,8-dihydropterin pyrophosphokinase [Candidatus Methanomethylicota archaeon]|mgnify:FL=1|uniref:6-hydroxymethyl-7,8-dihydropterin pyrophosphokinase n=1 Tax=Thermoproteota archaeon TaxID=2056631 RepID=A0A497F142_9CREN|nr:MAG: 6-hydroxymethyl-7,8-dihydropterin pyrophosphokinase [Candidatus Verstraetearchaeota archaeon]
MNLSKWRSLYFEIASKMGLSEFKDRYAALILSKLLDNRRCELNLLKFKLLKKTAIVYGAGPSLEDNLAEITKHRLYEKCVNISADGATEALLNFGLIPDVVTTDLDGNFEALNRANKQGSLLVVHAHGDNIDKLKIYVPLLKGIVIGSNQVGENFPHVYCFGGFTDGDRGVFLAKSMGVSVIILAGMDFGAEIGKYSKKIGEDLKERKLLKLEIGKWLVEEVAKEENVLLFNLSFKGEDIRGVKRVNISDVKRCIS